MSRGVLAPGRALACDPMLCKDVLVSKWVVS